jgi:hypothetical protein
MTTMDRFKNELHDAAFAATRRLGSCRVEDAIVIAGSPRSGTTLLLEALHELPGYKTVNEPLVREHVQEAHGFHARSYIERGQPASRQRSFLEHVLRGKLNPSAGWMFKSSTTLGHLIEHSTNNRLLVKFCRINRMLPWFAEQFDVRGIVMLVRHPCAVVNSMLRKGAWDKWTKDFIQQKKNDAASAVYIQHLPTEVVEVFAPVLERVSTQVEALTLIWCLDQYLPLLHASEHPWILVPYERLITHNREELARITNALGLRMNDAMLTALNKPSASVKGRVHQDPLDQLSKWKQQLTSQQIEEALSVVDEVGLSCFYSEAIEPDYSRLNKFQAPQYR